MITTLDELQPNITDSAFINCDCMEALKNFPDKYFDLAVVDPPYGGAGSLVAAYRTHHRFVGFEINKDYYTKAKERLEEEMSQMTIFDFMENDNGKDK